LHVFPDELVFVCPPDAENSASSVSGNSSFSSNATSPCLLVSRTAALTFEEGATATPLARLSGGGELRRPAGEAVASCEVPGSGICLDYTLIKSRQLLYVVYRWGGGEALLGRQLKLKITGGWLYQPCPCVVGQVEGIYGFYDLPSGPYVVLITGSKEALALPLDSGSSDSGSISSDSRGRTGLLSPLVLRRVTRLAVLPLGGAATAAARRQGADAEGLRLLRSALGAHDW
jgi:hypothetical protein